MTTATAQARWPTPPQVADRYGVDPSTVIAWIRNGELRGIDVSRRGAKRPRYRVDPVALVEFEAKRSATPPPKPARRRCKHTPDVIHFF